MFKSENTLTWLKTGISHFLTQTGIPNLLKPSIENQILILNFHRIYNFNRINLDKYPFDQSLFGISSENFQEIMTWLKMNYEFISEEELLFLRSQERRFKNLRIMITFDDGYRDNFELAFPILSHLKIPATFFIPTLNMSERTLFWWDIIAFLVKQSQKHSIYFQGMSYSIRSGSEKIKVAQTLIERVKNYSPYRRPLISHSQSPAETDPSRYLQNLADLTGVQLPNRETQSSELMTWENLKEISAAHDLGMAIGSHTHTHAILATLSEEEQRSELRVSKSILEDKLGVTIKSLAYPVGGNLHFTPETQKIAQEEGYLLAYSFYSGINKVPLQDPYNLLRAPFITPSSKLSLALSFPYQIFSANK